MFFDGFRFGFTSCHAHVCFPCMYPCLYVYGPAGPRRGISQTCRGTFFISIGFWICFSYLIKLMKLYICKLCMCVGVQDQNAAQVLAQLGALVKKEEVPTCICKLHACMHIYVLDFYIAYMHIYNYAGGRRACRGATCSSWRGNGVHNRRGFSTVTA